MMMIVILLIQFLKKMHTHSPQQTNTFSLISLIFFVYLSVAGVSPECKFIVEWPTFSALFFIVVVVVRAYTPQGYQNKKNSFRHSPHTQKKKRRKPKQLRDLYVIFDLFALYI